MTDDCCNKGQPLKQSKDALIDQITSQMIQNCLVKRRNTLQIDRNAAMQEVKSYLSSKSRIQPEDKYCLLGFQQAGRKIIEYDCNTDQTSDYQEKEKSY